MARPGGRSGQFEEHAGGTAQTPFVRGLTETGGSAFDVGASKAGRGGEGAEVGSRLHA